MDTDAGRMQDEIAIVTGSNSGLGRAIARRFAAEGARVVVTGRNTERGEAMVKSLAGLPGESVFLPADLSDENACQGLVASCVEHFGGLVTEQGAARAVVADENMELPLDGVLPQAAAEPARKRDTQPHLCNHGAPEATRAQDDLESGCVENVRRSPWTQSVETPRQYNLQR